MSAFFDEVVANEASQLEDVIVIRVPPPENIVIVPEASVNAARKCCEGWQQTKQETNALESGSQQFR